MRSTIPCHPLALQKNSFNIAKLAFMLRVFDKLDSELNSPLLHKDSHWSAERNSNI